MQGDLGAAVHWAATIGPHVPLTAMPYFYAPQLALPKILLAQDTPASREQAAEALSRLHAFVTAIHNTRFTIEVLALEASAPPRAGERAERARSPGTSRDPGATRRLRARLRRPGAEHGRSAGAAGRTRRAGVARDYVEQILHAFAAARSNPQPQPAVPPPAQATAQAAMIEPLTRREQQVLELLAQRMTAQEIAQTLVVSSQTVKRHRANVYQKLGVHSRRQALATAGALGILPSASRSGPPA